MKLSGGIKCTNLNFHTLARKAIMIMELEKETQWWTKMLVDMGKCLKSNFFRSWTTILWDIVFDKHDDTIVGTS